MTAGPGIHIHNVPGGSIIEATPTRQLPVGSQFTRHPWQALPVERTDAHLKVKVWQVSTLLKTITWTNKATISGFDQVHELTPTNHLRLTVNFDTYGRFSSAALAVASGSLSTPWVATNPSVAGDFAGTWRHIIAKLRAPVEGEPKVITISGSEYALYCPTTTHLLADWFCEDGKNHPALLPWFGGV